MSGIASVSVTANIMEQQEIHKEIPNKHVCVLKHYVEQACRIPSDKQVLLISGGEHLDEKARVCSYSAGTDTNPIYLFSKSGIESTSPPSASVDYGSEFDYKSKVRDSLNLAASYETVVQRTQLSQQLHELAKEQTKICERLVHDQHLQQQGWSAVVANLEDLTVEFSTRSELFQRTFNDYLKEHDSYIDFLSFFKDDLSVLAKIYIIPTLLDAELDNSADATNKGGAEACSTSEGDAKKAPITLLDWISSADSRSTMEQLFEHCNRGLEQFDEKVFKTLHAEIENAIESSNKPEMKEVKGLGDRLFGLEQLMQEAKRYVREQADIAASFLQNQTRAGNIGDTSILPDLCDSHRKQLAVMQQNHEHLCDIRRRCTRAKEELSVNLYHRLRWVMYVENLMLDANHRLVIYHDNLKRLRQHLEVLQQIHLAPSTYLSAVAEVVRRRAFSQAFLLWASELACHLLTIHNEETTRRKEFQSIFEGHFLNALFPGMDDLPPTFATQAPSIFDSTLPKISVDDMEELRESLPSDMTENLTVPDVNAIANLFFVKSIVKAVEVDDREVEEKLVEVVNEVGLASNLDQNLLQPAEESDACLVSGLAHLNLDKGCESETDTEEFEKVCQSPTSPRPGCTTQDVATTIEDDLHSSRTEHDRVKSIMFKLAVLSRQSIIELRKELTDLKSLYISEKSLIESHYESLSSSWENLTLDRDHKQTVHRLTMEHELELSDLRQIMHANSDEIKNLREENDELERRLKTLCEEREQLKGDLCVQSLNYESVCSDLRLQLNELDEDKERTVKDLGDELKRMHKAELDSIRTRFRLMKDMDRSPSDTNLEKIEEYEAMIVQIKETCEGDKLEAVKAAVALEAEQWAERLQHELRVCTEKYDSDKQILMQEITRRICEDKDKQIDVLREREANLNMECIKYKNTIQQLTECEAEFRSGGDLVERLEHLERQKCQLEVELSMERSKRLDESMQEMVASVAVLSEGCKVDMATSPVKQQKLTKSQTSLIKSKSLSIESCSVGEAVLIIWDSAHDSYTILQDSTYLYFLHSDCLEPLGLKKPGVVDNKLVYCTGEVIEKEYCHAKKPENRYKVPKGTKFYRIKVKQLTAPKEMNRSSTQHQSQQGCTTAAAPSGGVVSMEQSVTDSAFTPTKSPLLVDTTASGDTSNTPPPETSDNR